MAVSGTGKRLATRSHIAECSSGGWVAVKSNGKSPATTKDAGIVYHIYSDNVALVSGCLGNVGLVILQRRATVVNRPDRVINVVVGFDIIVSTAFV